MKPFHRRRGVTLVETMIACLIMVVGLVGVLGLINGVSLEMFFTSRTTLAAELAHRRMELLANTSYAGLTSGSEVRDIFQTSWTVGAESDNAKAVRVQVQFEGPSGRVRTVAANTLIRNPDVVVGSSISFTNFPSGVFQ